MALAKRCDRCKRFYESKNLNVRGEMINCIGLVSRRNTNDGQFIRDFVDCCPFCLEEFKQWLDNVPKEDAENDRC